MQSCSPTDSRDDGQMSTLPDHHAWWSHDIQLGWLDFDVLGHVTAAAYPAILEEAMVALVIEAWQVPNPVYVVARMEIDFLREVRTRRDPVRVYIAVDHLGRSSFTTTAVICSNDGRPCNVARTRYVAWDLETRRPRPLDTLQRERLLDLAAPRP